MAKRTHLGIVAVVCVLAGVAAAAEKPKLAVADFRIVGNVGLKDAGPFVAELVLGHFDTEKHQLVRRAELVKILAEQKLTMAELVSNPAVAGGKKIKGVRYVVVGSIVKLGDLMIFARLVDVTTGGVGRKVAVSASATDARDLDAKLKRLAALLSAPEAAPPAPKTPPPKPSPSVQAKWPFDAKEAGRRQKETARKLSVPVEMTLRVGQGETMTLALIPPGPFVMGSRPGDRGALADETPQRLVTIGEPFYMGVHEVTRGQFGAFVRATRYQTEAEKGGWAYGVTARGWARVRGLTWRRPGFQQTDSHPAVAVSWNDATAFCKWLSKTTGKRVALPTEAQWEYACRAGSQAAFQWGDDPDGGKGWCNAADRTARSKFGNWPSVFNWSDGRVYTAPVGSYIKNAFGLYDMHGNVWEWCRDYYAPQYSTAGGNTVDPTGPPAGSLRVVRGGSWGGSLGDYRSAHRCGRTPVTRGDGDGFRVVVLGVGAG